MVAWFTLSYVPQSGPRITLYNLQRAGCDYIEQTQRSLGSEDFARTEQTHHFSQQELDLLRGRTT